MAVTIVSARKDSDFDKVGVEVKTDLGYIMNNKQNFYYWNC